MKNFASSGWNSVFWLLAIAAGLAVCAYCHGFAQKPAPASVMNVAHETSISVANAGNDLRMETFLQNPVLVDDSSLPADYERVRIFQDFGTDALENKINGWLKNMQKDGFRLEITGRLQSGGGDDGKRSVTVTIFYKYHYK